jgi:hypothetical protein
LHKTDRHDITEILLKVALNTIKQTKICFPFLTVALHESGTRKDISNLGAVYNKDLSNQGNLTAKIEPAKYNL